MKTSVILAMLLATTATGAAAKVEIAATSAASAAAQAAETNADAAKAALAEARSLLTTAAKASGRPAYSAANAVKFKASDNVFLKSALAVDFTYRAATVTLPLFEGRSPTNKPVWYIVTEASDFEVAKTLGVNYAPKLARAAGTPGAQEVTVKNGIVQFRGDVDFSPEFEITAGDPPGYFPPKSFNPGAVADAEWSSIAVMPSGVVLNLQLVQNDTGGHDRMKAIDLKKRTVTMSLLDGFHDGKQYYYHLVTDVSADLPAVLEQGVYAPRLGKIPTFGKSRPQDDSALLGFSPVLNGATQKGSGEDQGFGTAIANGGIDPINVFPIPPRNDDPALENNYSPLWDAHVSEWTPAAIKAGKVRRITSLDDLKSLIASGDVTSAFISPAGPGNPYVGGLRSTQVTINCPVIAQPDLPPQ